MIFFVLSLFSLSLYCAQNSQREESAISNARRNWSYILGVVGIAQFLMGFTYEPIHFFIGAFVGAWAWFVYVARKGRVITWKTTIKTIVLVLSSIIYLATINNPNSWGSVALEAIFWLMVVVLRFDFNRVPSPTTVETTGKTPSKSGKSINNTDKLAEPKPQFKLGNKKRRLIYWIGGIILFIIILPFIILAIDKAVECIITILCKI